MPTTKNIINDFLHLFFPHLCAGCETDVLNKEAPLCLACINELPVTNFHQHINNPVEKHFWGRMPVANASSLFHFTHASLVQKLLHQFKYKDNKEIGYFLGRMMGSSLRQSNRFNDVHALIALPLHAQREKQRGYNQADILCQGMAQIMQLPVIDNAIIRMYATETQTQKNRIERWQNMKGQFKLTNAIQLNNKHLLLVDDVVTTGATLESCGQELLKAENIRLSISTLAYTVQ